MNDTTNTRACAAADRCRDYDPSARQPAAVEPPDRLCAACLRAAERDVRCLVYDYVDLEQDLPPSLSQALDTQARYSGGGHQVPLREHVEEMQRQIWWVTTTWAEVLTDRVRLADPPVRCRDGYAVAWAVGVLSPRLRDLARAEAVELVDYPLGTDDETTRYRSVHRSTPDGLDAVRHLSMLHSRARALLGRTRRTFWVPGDCWQAACAVEHARQVAAGHNRDEWLYRTEPARERDEPPVRCRYCDEPRTYDEYQQYVGLLVWPRQRVQRDAA